MKFLKIPILLFGAAGLALAVKDLDALRAGFEQAPLHSALIVLGWALPVAMGLLALIRPPMQSWHAAAALAGFAVVAIRTRIWQAFPSLAELAIEAQIGIGVLVAGLVASALAVARPEGGG